MTQVTIYRIGETSPGLSTIEVWVRGHAASSDVCNYITGAVYCFYEYILAVRSRRDGCAEVFHHCCDKGSGAFYLYGVGDERVCAVLDAMALALAALEESCPGSVAFVDADGRALDEGELIRDPGGSPLADRTDEDDDEMTEKGDGNEAGCYESKAAEPPEEMQVDAGGGKECGR